MDQYRVMLIPSVVTHASFASVNGDCAKVERVFLEIVDSQVRQNGRQDLQRVRSAGSDSASRILIDLELDDAFCSTSAIRHIYGR